MGMWLECNKGGETPLHSSTLAAAAPHEVLTAPTIGDSRSRCHGRCGFHCRSSPCPPTRSRRRACPPGHGCSGRGASWMSLPAESLERCSNLARPNALGRARPVLALGTAIDFLASRKAKTFATSRFYSKRLSTMARPIPPLRQPLHPPIAASALEGDHGQPCALSPRLPPYCLPAPR